MHLNSGDCSHAENGPWHLANASRESQYWIQQAERERLVGKIARRIHQSLDLQEILTTTAADVRQFLQTDRVIVYQFETSCTGTVVVESVGEDWQPILGTTIKDPCFDTTYVGDYKQGRICAIANIHTSGLAQCHIDLLTQFQVIANLVLPITQGETLWGLLIAHHCKGPRQWQPLEVELLQDLATQAAIAIQQSELFQRVQLLNTNLELQVQERTQQLQQSLEFAAVLKRVTDRVRDSLNEHHILQTAVKELVSVLKVDYCCAALYNPERTEAVVQYEFSQTTLASGVGQVLKVADTARVHGKLLSGKHFEFYEAERISYLQSRETGDLACPNLFDRFAAKLLAPIFVDPTAYEAEENLGEHAYHANTGAIGYLAVVSQTQRVFSEIEIKLVNQVANQCAIAIRQARLYEASQAQVKALKKLNQLKDDFLSTVSHEIRTPLASMKIAIQMLKVSLQQSLDHSEKTTRYLSILDDQCEREIELVDDLLDLQKLEAGEHSFNLVDIDIQSWLPQLIHLFNQQSKKPQQTLRVDVPANIPTLTSDPSSLERILLELLNNACKYSPPNATIKLFIQLDIDTICFGVCNSGIEIPANEFTHIFEKFYRIPNADPWKQGGTGLGLALVRKLVQHLGGLIEVDSQANQTCFMVKLPYGFSKKPAPKATDAG